MGTARHLRQHQGRELVSEKRMAVVAACAAAFMGIGASAAFAGEVTGNGDATGMRGHANSICGFSGREDDSRSPLRTQTPHEVWLNPEEFPVPPQGVVANPAPGTPGQECNGNLNPQK
jgi:hypothetical protein